MSDHYSKSPRYAWFVLSLLILLNVLNFVDRQLVSSLQVPLKADPDLHLDDVKISLLAGYAFSCVYAIAGLFLGMVADRWHRPRLIAVGLLVWSAMTAASGLAQTFWHLALARIFVAVGEATLTPAAVAIVGDVFSPQRRSLASSLYYLGIPLGAGLSMIVASILEPLPGFGWRGCYFALGIVGVLLVGVVAFLKDPARESVAVKATQPESTGPTLLTAQLREVFVTLSRSPALVMTMVGAVVINIGVGTTLLDISWLVHERKFKPSEAAMFLGVLFLLGGSLGSFLGGWLGDVFHRRFPAGGRLLALVTVQLSVTPFGILFRFIGPDSLLFPVCYFFGSIFVTMMYGPVLATVQELTPVRSRATMIAFLVIWLNILGASLGNLLAAFVSKQLGSYTWGIFLTNQISLIAIPLFLLAARRIQVEQTRLTVPEGAM